MTNTLTARLPDGHQLFCNLQFLAALKTHEQKKSIKRGGMKGGGEKAKNNATLVSQTLRRISIVRM